MVKTKKPVDMNDEGEIGVKLQQMQATLKQISQENNYGFKTQLLNAYPLLQRGIEIEHQSQMEIDGLKTYLAG